MNIKKAANIIEQINGIVQNWKHYAAEVGVDKKLANAIRKTLIKL